MKELRKSLYFISFPMYFVGFIFPIYAASLGADIIEIGILYSVFSIVGIAIRPVVGKLIDQRGRRLGIIIGIISYIVVNFLFTFGDNFRYLLLARIIQSLAASFLWISVDTFISDISDKTNRGQNFGILDQTLVKGQITGSFIGFTILFNNLSANPFKTIFSVFLFTSLISLYYAVRTLPETVELKRDYERGKIKNKKDLKIFLIIIAIISLITSLTGPIYLLYLQDNITSELALISFLFIPSSILSIFLPKKFGQIADKYGREKIILIGLLASGILQIFIPFNNSYYGFMILYTIISIVAMFYRPAFSSLIIDFVGEEKRGRSYGLYNLATGIGGAIGPLAGSFIYKNLGNHIVFYIKGILLLTVTIFLYHTYIVKLNSLETE